MTSSDQEQTWIPASLALDQVAFATGSRKNAPDVLGALLSDGKIRSSARYVVEEADDRALTAVIPGTPSLRVFRVDRHSLLGVFIIGTGFWEMVFDGDGATARSLWSENVFSTGSGSEPIVAQIPRNAKFPALVHQSRITLYDVHLDQHQLDSNLVASGIHPTRIILAKEPSLRATKLGGKRISWHITEELSLAAAKGCLDQLIGPVSAPKVRGNLIRKLQDLFAAAQIEEPSLPTLYRRASMLLKVDADAKSAALR